MTATLDTPPTSTYEPHMPVGRVHPDPINPRTKVDVDDDFIASCAAGIHEPLIVRPDHRKDTLLGDPEDFLIVAGERRYTAATAASLDTVPVIVRYDLADDADALEVMIIENGQRESLPPMDEARAYAVLVEKGRTQRDIASAVGREQGTVSKRLSLLKLPTRAQQLLDDQRITVKTTLGMTGLIKDNGRLSKVLDYASQQGVDDTAIGRKVFFELDQMQQIKDRAKREKADEKARAERNAQTTAPETIAVAAQDDEDDDNDRDQRHARQNKARGARASLIKNLATDGYPGDAIATEYIARIAIENAIESGETGALCETLGIVVDPDCENQMDAEEAALRAYPDPLRIAFADALDIGERAYNKEARCMHLKLLADNGYACDLPEERALFGDTVPDGDFEDEQEGREQPPVTVDAGDVSAIEPTGPSPSEPPQPVEENAELAEPFKAYSAFPVKSIVNIVNNDDTTAERLEQIISYETANRADAKILDAARARLDALAVAS